MDDKPILSQERYLEILQKIKEKRQGRKINKRAGKRPYCMIASAYSLRYKRLKKLEFSIKKLD